MQKEISQNKTPQEGRLTEKVEKQTAKIPSIAYLALAGGATAASLALAMMKRNKGWANFIGLWVPSLLLIGVYNKLVKLEGSDSEDMIFH